MGTAHDPESVLLVFAAFSRHEAALEWAGIRAAKVWSPIARVSAGFEFVETEYYAATMGVGLHKQLFACEQLVDPGQLADVKRMTNQWELEYAATHNHAELRPLNLDPGYITPAKLVLASTKDFAHRIFLRDGIYAEVTLQFRHGAWEPLPWTFPDYRRADYHEFYRECRDYLRQRPSQQKQQTQQKSAHP